MASIRREITVFVPAATAWEAVRDVGAIHTRLAPGLVTHTKLEDDGKFRVVTFADGLVLRERIVSVDDDARRLVWSVVGEPFEHHNASVEVIGDERHCRVVWSADLLPHDLADTVAEIMERGLSLTKQTQEAAAQAPETGTQMLPNGAQTPPNGANPESPAERHLAADPSENVFYPAQHQPTLHHVSLFVSDLKVSSQFYTSGLGLTLRERFEDIIGQRDDDRFPFGVASVFLEAGEGRYVELHPAGPGTMDPPGFPLNHLAIGVADVDTTYARALAAGGSAIDIPIPDQHWDGTPLNVQMSGERPESMRMAFLQGPDGELIELYQSGVSG